MEAKEKAYNLVNSFFRLRPSKDNLRAVLVDQCIAEKSALICVDEINNALQKIPDIQVAGNVLLDQIKYYQEVKQEIKL